MYPALEVRGLVNRFGEQVVHDGLDMEVQPDEVFGIVGGSGSGKSVLLRTILGLQRPQAGTVRIDGSDITRLSEAQLRPIKARYGVTFQQGALYSGAHRAAERAAAHDRAPRPAGRGARRAGAAQDPPGRPAGRGGAQVPGGAVRWHGEARRPRPGAGARPDAAVPGRADLGPGPGERRRLRRPGVVPAAAAQADHRHDHA